MNKKSTDPAAPDQTTQPADAGFLTPVEALPQEGGSYTRDPKTGELTKLTEVPNGSDA